jgi:hypothetical protein
MLSVLDFLLCIKKISNIGLSRKRILITMKKISGVTSVISDGAS